MAQLIKDLTAKPRDLNLIPKTHGRRKELSLASCPLTSHTPYHLCARTYTNIHNIEINKCRKYFFKTKVIK